MTTQIRFRVGDLVLFQRRECRVLRVNDCSALLAVPRPPRTFATRFAGLVTIRPKPALVRIAPDADFPILNR